MNEAEAWVGKVIWMSRVKGYVVVHRGRMVRELIGKPSVEPCSRSAVFKRM